MELKSSAPDSSSNGLNGNYRWGYGGTIPEHVTSEQCYKSWKKSKVRLNDQLIPKPTDVNVVEKMIKIPTVKEHPYSSHISRFAMFPSFCSPDDVERGVRAALRPFPNRHIPKRTPNVTLLSKAIGGPYRLEILETAVNTRRKAGMWAGENVFFEEENKVFYPAPTKTVLPNPKLRDWDVTLSERTSNMLKNLERALWVTSYQMHYTGSGPANPLTTDDFKERICNLSGINSHSAPLRERSYPVFLPSKPKEGRRQWSKVQFDEAPSQQSESQLLKVGPKGQTSSGSHQQLLLRSIIEEEGQTESRELLHSTPNSSILPRPPILPGVHPSAPSLLELQQSFSKSDAHKNFHSSVRQAVVNLRDNVVSGKKHNFFGINCNYLHG